MFDILGNLPALLGGLAALIALIWGKGRLDRRKGRKEGRQELTDELQEADNEEANDIRRRVDVARELHTTDSGRGFRD